ncbi:MAG: SpoIID/LytB domain-containing protein [Bacteroidales bacterium]|nr:SpoIID/LytB domain-containing protein [Bacteroidales bacterium]
MKLRLTIFFLLLAGIGVSQNINIRIFSDKQIENCVFYAKSGKYDIVANNKIICSLEESQSATISRKNHKIYITVKNEVFTADTLILFRGNTQDNIFQIRFHNGKIKAREYDNDLYIKTSRNSLVLINDVNFEKYIAGVVESEGGAKANIAYYKAQAILCRTYAANFYKRHLKQGYNLCDAVHCQAYVGRCRYSKAIVEATKATQGLVLVDENRNLIEATFYSNSGGESCNSEDVWNKPIPYLRGKEDPFSVGQPSYIWTKTIPRDQWEEYLKKKGYPLADSADLSFDQFNRKKYLETDCTDSLLLLTTVRSDWKLKSTFFCIDSRENEIVIYGKGFGHGVGMSQEGAMEMARQGYSYQDILHFYYTNVSLMNISKLKFFQIE